MAKYLRKFESHTQYEEARQNLILPNVSLCKQENEMHYNPYVPPQPIVYYASAKLSETTSTGTKSGLHTKAFSGASGQLTITSHTFENGVGTVEFNGDVTKVGNYAFYQCTNLTSIDIPNSVTSIGAAAFQNCSSLTSCTIGSGVTSIGSGAFYYCSGLTSIDIPSGVTSIGNDAFNYCRSLTSISIPNSVTTIGDFAFRRCHGLTICTIGSSVTSIGKEAFFSCTNLTSITSNATTVPTIQSSTFQGVKTDGTLTVPSGSSGYDVWMQNANYYLGLYNWTKVEQ